MTSRPQTVVFDALNNIAYKKSMKDFRQHVNDEELWKTWSKFMILRYLTMSDSEAVRSIVISRYATLERMPDIALYRWLIQNIPKQRTGYIKYIK